MEGVSDFIREQIRASASLNQRISEAEEHVRNTWRVKALAMVQITSIPSFLPTTPDTRGV